MIAVIKINSVNDIAISHLRIIARAAGASDVTPAAVESSIMYPYGIMAGDTIPTFSECDNGYSLITIATGFRYFGTLQTDLYVSSFSRVDNETVKKAEAFDEI
jgi:hypothetical protein